MPAMQSFARAEFESAISMNDFTWKPDTTAEFSMERSMNFPTNLFDRDGNEFSLVLEKRSIDTSYYVGPLIPVIARYFSMTGRIYMHFYSGPHLPPKNTLKNVANTYTET